LDGVVFGHFVQAKVENLPRNESCFPERPKLVKKRVGTKLILASSLIPGQATLSGLTRG
jgi:hypothetical protein